MANREDEMRPDDPDHPRFLEYVRGSGEREDKRNKIAGIAVSILIGAGLLLAHFSSGNRQDKPEQGKTEVKEAGDDPVKLLARAGQSFIQKDWASAVNCAGKALAEKEALNDNQRFAAYMLKGLAEYEMRQFDAAEQSLSAALEIKPDFRAYSRRSMIRVGQRREKQAVQDLRKNVATYEAAQLNDYSPEDRLMYLATDYNNLAWYLATSNDNTVRNGALAVKYAEKSVQIARSAVNLDTLAAAYAESGKYDLAVKTQEEVLKMLQDLAAKLGGKLSPAVLKYHEERMKLYRDGTPYRQPVDAQEKRNAQEKVVPDQKTLQIPVTPLSRILERGEHVLAA